MQHVQSSTDRSSGTRHPSRRRIAVGALATLIVTGLPAVAHVARHEAGLDAAVRERETTIAG